MMLHYSMLHYDVQHAFSVCDLNMRIMCYLSAIFIQLRWPKLPRYAEILQVASATVTSTKENIASKTASRVTSC